MLIKVSDSHSMKCNASFKSNPDYMSSSTTIYRQKTKCIQDYDKGTVVV